MSFKKNDWRSQSLRFLLTWMVKVLFRECRGRMEEKQASMYRKRKERCCAVVCRFDWSSLIGRRCSLPCRARPTTLYIWWPGCCPSWHTQSVRFLGPTFCFFSFPFVFSFYLFISFFFCFVFYIFRLAVEILFWALSWLFRQSHTKRAKDKTKWKGKKKKMERGKGKDKKNPVSWSMIQCQRAGEETDVINNRRRSSRRRARQAKTTNQFLLMV